MMTEKAMKKWRTEIKMSTNETNSVKDTQVSKSMQKRIDRKKKNESVKREGVIGAVIGIFAIVLILGGIIWSIVATALKSEETIEPNAEFGRYITEQGMVEGIKASSIVTLPADYASITIPKSEIEYTDAEFEEDKQAAIDNHPVLDKETDKHIENGDVINLDYVGSIDGVEFEGGSTNGNGSRLEIGSGTFIPGFEDQLVGHQINDNFDINVTFPENYGNEELSGKEAVFNITINGFYVEGEFTDEFVAENLKAYATTVEGYKQYLKEAAETGRINEYVATYINENSSLSKYPKKYLRQLKSTRKYQDMQSFEYMNQMYAMYGMQTLPSFEEYMQMSMEEYDASLEDTCKAEEVEILARQAIAELNGITVSEADMKEYAEKMNGEGSYDSVVESYGKSYLAQTVLQQKVNDFLVNNATVK